MRFDLLTIARTKGRIAAVGNYASEVVALNRSRHLVRLRDGWFRLSPLGQEALARHEGKST